MSATLDSPASWRRLALSLALSLIGNVGMWAIIVILPAVQAEFGLDRADASIPYTATMIGFALGNFLIGGWVDRWGVSRALAVSAVMIAGGFAAAALAPNLWTLTIVQAGIGFATAASFGPLIADVSQWFLKRRGIAVALIASGNYLSGAIWPLILADILAGPGWRAAYLVIAATALAVMLPMTWALRKPLPEEAMRASDSAAALRARSSGLSPRALTWALAAAGIGCCVAMSMPQVHIVAYCVDLGYGPAVGAEMLSLMLLGGVASRLVSGLVADRLGGVLTLLIGSTLQMLALFLYLPTTGLMPLYIVSLVFGLAQGGIVPSYALIVREYLPAREAGARVGFVIMATILGMALGGWMSGWIYDLTGSYRWAFLNGIAFNALNIAIMLAILARSHPRRPAMAAS
ncbi:putative oxalate/formate antiporter [Roseibacterium elongatum DSM 19469]|uniref:Putative oxalate/formate antiporter n=1 Tax=Roseicyclus elongatus DSM 19469 TaxID=1294273 RepID=W8SJX1_9RHOB|nr:MFS transporter [Roseibacterium elongatum]AHM02810.1 putative oxalate/formate antiporter [Roseibacterium elongatum DSM 19469]